jgi:hypothetical protein
MRQVTVSAIVVHRLMLDGRSKRLAANEKRRELQEWRRIKPRRRHRRPNPKKEKKGRRPPSLGLSFWRSSSVRPLTGHYHFVVPKTFSLLENLEESLEALMAFSLRLGSEATTSVYIDHLNCEHLDLCASAVLDVLILRARRFRRSRFQLSGRYSQNEKVNVLLRSIGLLANIRHAHANLPKEVINRFELFGLQIGHRSNPARSTTSERVSGQLVEFLDKCVFRLGYQLRSDWKINLAGMVSEALDNAEQHASTDSEWYAIAYFEQRSENDVGGECHLVIFNFGDSVYQSLRRNTTSRLVKEKIQALADHHRKRNFFGVLSSKWTEETLWTLYALQQGVSRFKGEGNEDRGNGTVKMIEAMGQLSAEGRKVVLISGGTCIQHDGQYTMKDEYIDGDLQKIIAFNESNSLLLPPDSKSVQGIQGSFPGTLMSARFEITSKDLATKNEVAREHPTSN